MWPTTRITEMMMSASDKGIVSIRAQFSRFGRMLPRCPIRPLEQLVRCVVVHDLVRRGIPRERTAELHRQIGQDAGSRRDVPLLDIAHWLAAVLDAGEKILHVAADGRRDVLFEVLL